MLLSTLMAKAQDVIVMKDGSTIICKVMEIGTSEVKYKKASNLDGPLYSILNSEIQNINFENGDKEKFKESTAFSNETEKSDSKVVVLKYGTEFPIQVESPVRAKDVDEGQYISFKSMIDIDVDGVKVIRAGTPVKGIVYKANRSSWWGTKGKLGIRLDHIQLPDGNRIPVKGDIYVTGKNRTALSVLLFLFVTWPACFICGSKAELPYGFDTMAKIGANVEFSKDGKAFVQNVTTQKIVNAEPLTDKDVDSEPIKQSSLDSIPDLPCFATLIYKNGKEEKVYIIEVKYDKEKIIHNKVTKDGKLTWEKYNVKFNKLSGLKFDEAN